MRFLYYKPTAYRIKICGRVKSVRVKLESKTPPDPISSPKLKAKSALNPSLRRLLRSPLTLTLIWRKWERAVEAAAARGGSRRAWIPAAAPSLHHRHHHHRRARAPIEGGGGSESRDRAVGIETAARKATAKAQETRRKGERVESTGPMTRSRSLSLSLIVINPKP